MKRSFGDVRSETGVSERGDGALKEIGMGVACGKIFWPMP